MHDSSNPEPDQGAAPGARDPVTEQVSEEQVPPWWKRSPPLAAGAAMAIGLATLWFGNMLGRVPLDEQSTFGYLLMMPMLLIVPVFSAAGLRLAWEAVRRQGVGLPRLLALAAMAANGLAMLRFGSALVRIFGT